MDNTFLTLGLSLIGIGLLLLFVDLFVASGALAALALVCGLVARGLGFRWLAIVFAALAPVTAMFAVYLIFASSDSSGFMIG